MYLLKNQVTLRSRLCEGPARAGRRAANPGGRAGAHSSSSWPKTSSASSRASSTGRASTRGLPGRPAPRVAVVSSTRSRDAYSRPRRSASPAKPSSASAPPCNQGSRRLLRRQLQRVLGSTASSSGREGAETWTSMLISVRNRDDPGGHGPRQARGRTSRARTNLKLPDAYAVRLRSTPEARTRRVRVESFDERVVDASPSCIRSGE